LLHEKLNPVQPAAPAVARRRAQQPTHVARLAMKQKDETLKAETGERKAKTRGVRKEGCEEQEDAERKKPPLTAAASVL
jgi:hypothetical protein